MNIRFILPTIIMKNVYMPLYAAHNSGNTSKYVYNNITMGTTIEKNWEIFLLRLHLKTIKIM